MLAPATCVPLAPRYWGGTRDNGIVHPYQHVFAVIRHDKGRNPAEIRNVVTIVAIVPTADEAISEVDRLSDLVNDDYSKYFWQSARYYPEGRSAGTAH